MWNPFKHRSVVDEAIGKVLTEMNTYDVGTAEYNAAIEHLGKLHEMKTKESNHRISPDTVAIVAGNLVGVLIIVAYESRHVIRPTAINQLLRARP